MAEELTGELTDDAPDATPSASAAVGAVAAANVDASGGGGWEVNDTAWATFDSDEPASAQPKQTTSATDIGAVESLFDAMDSVKVTDDSAAAGTKATNDIFAQIEANVATSISTHSSQMQQQRRASAISMMGRSSGMPSMMMQRPHAMQYTVIGLVCRRASS